MKKNILLIVTTLFSPFLSFGQPNTTKIAPIKNKTFSWSKIERRYIKNRDNIKVYPRIEETGVAEPLKYMTAMKNWKQKVWMFPQAGRSGSWVTPKPEWDLFEKSLNRKAEYSYLVETPNSYRAYPYYSVRAGREFVTKSAPPKSLNLTNLSTINEKMDKLAIDEVVNDGFEGVEGKMNIYYIKKINLGIMTFVSNQDHIIVTDTLYIPTAQPFKTGFIEISQASRPYVKVVANCIVYESPILLNLIGEKEADFVFAANKIIFKCPYSNLQPSQLPPPFITVAANITNYVYKDYMLETEQKLLFRLYVNIMKQCLDELRNTTDPWRKDKLVEIFQTYRFNRINQEIRAKDLLYNPKFNVHCDAFDKQFKDYSIERIRAVKNTKILAFGNVNKLPLEKLLYTVLPSQARVVPKITDSTKLLGSILYMPSGDEKMKLQLELDLEHDSSNFKLVQNELNAKGVNLQSKLPFKGVSIEEQPLKIKGKTIGRIIPLSNQAIKLDIILKEEAKTLIELFPKAGHISFRIDFTVEGFKEKITQEFTLVIEPEMLKKLDYSNPLESFEIWENSKLAEEIKLSSTLNAAQDKEGALNYIELLLNIDFGNTSLQRGPYRLSSYNTLASEVIIPILKKSKDYTITISGRALYQNGERDVVPFATRDKIIIIDESAFSKK